MPQRRNAGAGKHKRPIADLATKDSNDFMRASLLNLWDTERVELERQKPGKRDLARLEQLAKLSITIARIPGQKDLAPKNPATRNQDGRREPQLVGGTAGDLINAMRAQHHAKTKPQSQNTKTRAQAKTTQRVAGSVRSRTRRPSLSPHSQACHHKVASLVA
jgi:hypothetical protein